MVRRRGFVCTFVGVGNEDSGVGSWKKKKTSSEGGDPVSRENRS